MKAVVSDPENICYTMALKMHPCLDRVWKCVHFSPEVIFYTAILQIPFRAMQLVQMDPKYKLTGILQKRKKKVFFPGKLPILRLMLRHWARICRKVTEKYQPRTHLKYVGFSYAV